MIQDDFHSSSIYIYIPIDRNEEVVPKILKDTFGNSTCDSAHVPLHMSQGHIYLKGMLENVIFVQVVCMEGEMMQWVLCVKIYWVILLWDNGEVNMEDS